ncbi:LysR family transcriptional regulator [Nonomuraea cavernae]|uniref:LysR family transcriptional regulator n=1 Tax=Nonomuraea cavernae TaxID=2045107 RepID=A0A918DNP1_9ACTN|nr:LysR family transcriptional regulator [Nonomuraea cavernae]MCA2189362.1 LysR family transcriptional regulator [Nonomuraea cavernae]GGO77004.1 LysR family transcriptional regulator [Nonomuraea cavernae]
MLREIQCFAGVAARLSFSRAAADLGMSQPAVSQAVSRLERATGVRLFERTARQVRLTAEGRTLLSYADRLLEAAAEFSSEAARLTRPLIHLAYPPLIGPLAARIARRLAGRAPAIGVELRPAGRGDASAALTRGEVSAAILATPAPAPFGTAARFHITIDHLAVPAGHPLWARARVAPDDLTGQVLLTPGRSWTGLPGRPRVVADDDFGAALDLVAAGAGLLPSPQLLVRAVRRDDIRFVPFDAGDLRITYALAWSRERVTPELMALVQAVQEALWTR